MEGLEQNSKVEKVDMERNFFGRLVGSWKHPDWGSKDAFAQAIRCETGSSIWGERERGEEVWSGSKGRHRQILLRCYPQILLIEAWLTEGKSNMFVRGNLQFLATIGFYQKIRQYLLISIIFLLWCCCRHQHHKFEFKAFCMQADLPRTSTTTTKFF